MSDLSPYPDSAGPPAFQYPPGYAPPGQYPRQSTPASGFEVTGGAPGDDVTGIGVDPLVTPPAEGFSGWWMRVWTTFARSWASLLPIIGLTSGLPGAAFVLIITGPLHTMNLQLHAFQLAQRQDPTTPIPSDLGSTLATVYAYLGLYFLVFLILGALGWAASIWTITKQAAGEPAPFGRALGYGLKEFPRTFGWLLLYFLMITVGTMCCILPGLYLGVAGSMIVPLVVFSRGSISDSFRMVNRNFGGVLGRILTVYAATIMLGVIVWIVDSVVGGSGANASTGTVAAGQIVGVILAIPAMIILVIGVTLTFAEMRAREMPTTTALLNQAL